MELDELFARAIAFYEGCPDGQYDEVAVAALRYMHADIANKGEFITTPQGKRLIQFMLRW